MNRTIPHILSDLRRHLQPLSSIKQVEAAQAFLTKTGLFFTQTPLLAKLIAFASLSPLGCLSHAQSLFQETAMDDPFTCSTMIRAYTNSDFPIKGIHIYNHMIVTQVGCDHFTYNFALKACARVMKGMKKDDAKVFGLGIDLKGGEIHGRVLKLGFDSDLYVQNSLLFVYAQAGSVGLARQVFDEMSERSVSSWNIMISAYDQITDFESADWLFQLMPQKNVVSWNTLLGRHVRLGNVEAAKMVFEEMVERDAVSWNSMIAGYVQVRDYGGALELFREMQVAEVEATEVTLISVLGACAETGELEIGRKIHESLKGKQHKIEGYLGTALVDMYSKCGKLSSAWEVFSGMKMRPVGCWNAMIMGFAVHGHCEEALELFADMEMQVGEVKPNRITFVGVLIACSHKGLVEEGRRYFSYMIQKCKIVPDTKHYGCMVDLLSRWGLLDEAYQMIKAVPSLSSSLLWRTLLGACKVHGNVELAEQCFEQLAKLEPLKDADYVLLSNIYAEAEKWHDVERLRNEMVCKGVPKSLGFSHVEMK
ncbi:putative tetratricopeptide-like helical domain-containing protein [Rosa chinensis]|uniref:Putative tetratricopeptide-like helical domain-containing protein n=1 Tax=Rosa chinensis TaxID=74649 RepID=A0A2P6R8I3_ROSCH|nr:pentatricopeptide repeat-containing protein At5g15300 [Rosa chinensis]PRQ42721.1 putative tetratricopeptide-like helical domain-containing protein [Rosa chinensis]